MPRDPQGPHFARTLRVRNLNQIGVLAAVLSVIAKHGGNVGDIRTVHQSRTSMVRDIDLVVDSLDELDVILAELERMPESAVLGLGNLGALAAMPVLEGKAALLAHLTGVNAFPIALKSQQPDDIVAAVAAISASFGVIQLEDIASPRCFEIEPRLQAAVDVAVFHDDQHGTAAVVLAALINACHLAEIALDGL